jgi:hypothetical protein
VVAAVALAAVGLAGGAATAATTAPRTTERSFSAVPDRVALATKHITITHDGSQVRILGSAVNDQAYTFRRVVLRVRLLDLAGDLLNPLLPGETPQEVSVAPLAPGAVIPFQWVRAQPAGAVAALVKVIGVHPMLHAPTATATARITGSHDVAGPRWAVDGLVRNVSQRATGVSVQVAAWDAAGHLVGLSEARIGSDNLVVLAAKTAGHFHAMFRAVQPAQVARLTATVASD